MNAIYAVAQTAGKSPIIYGVGNDKAAAVSAANEWLDSKTSVEGIEAGGSLSFIMVSAELAEMIRKDGFDQAPALEADENGVYCVA